MPDDNFQALLDAEEKAEQVVAEARTRRDETIDRALEQVNHEEKRFESRIPEIHDSFRTRALQRADQVVDEIKRRYEERASHLRRLAEEREKEALDAAYLVLTKSKK